MSQENYPIDFVCPWVDGNDPEWQKEYNKYAPMSKGDKREERFRDWDLMRYWFRGVEKFAPWVNKVYFVTCGHVPEWLNLNAPKLRFVRHDEYIPGEHLPVFNANPIELCMHRLPGLSEHFVYFNDDLFLTRPVKRERFFKQGLPCDMAVLNAISSSQIGHILLNDIDVINRHFSKRTILRQSFRQWFRLGYGGRFLLQNICLSPWPRFTGFVDPHFTVSFLKSTFGEVWEKCGNELQSTSMTRFRENGNFNQYLMRYWQLAKGEFAPINMMKDARYTEIKDDTLQQIESYIINQEQTIIVLNDSMVSDFKQAKELLQSCFNHILPDKSTFEK